MDTSRKGALSSLSIFGDSLQDINKRIGYILNRQRIMKQTFQKITLVAFLILVAFLALFFTLIWTNSLFGENGGWAEREGIIDKLTIFIFYADMPVLLVASITSIISFFKRGHIWAPITKGIVINIIVWLVLLVLIFLAFASDIKSTIQSILIVGFVAWMILQIPKMVKALIDYK